MAKKPSEKSTLAQNQITLNQKLFGNDGGDTNFNINLGNVKAAIICECTSSPNSDGVYNATVLNNLASDGFAVYNGLTVTCRFTVANTTANPKFMINNLGSAPLRTSTTSVGSGSWKANAILQLQYCAFSNGDTYWLIVGSDSASEENGIITNANGTTIYNKQSVDNQLNSALTPYSKKNQFTFGVGAGGISTYDLPKIDKAWLLCIAHNNQYASSSGGAYLIRGNMVLPIVANSNLSVTCSNYTISVKSTLANNPLGYLIPLYDN